MDKKKLTKEDINIQNESKIQTQFRRIQHHSIHANTCSTIALCSFLLTCGYPVAGDALAFLPIYCTFLFCFLIASLQFSNTVFNRGFTYEYAPIFFGSSCTQHTCASGYFSISSFTCAYGNGATSSTRVITTSSKEIFCFLRCSSKLIHILPLQKINFFTPLLAFLLSHCPGMTGLNLLPLVNSSNVEVANGCLNPNLGVNTINGLRNSL